MIEYKPLLDKAIELSGHKPERCVILQRPQARAKLGERDVDWGEAMAATKPADCVPVAATDPLYVLYTSGTTAKPKGVIRDNGGHAVALRWSMANIYDIGPGEVFFAASDIGWVVGHSYIVYAPLLTGATTILTIDDATVLDTLRTLLRAAAPGAAASGDGEDSSDTRRRLS